MFALDAVQFMVGKFYFYDVISKRDCVKYFNSLVNINSKYYICTVVIIVNVILHGLRIW